MTNNSLHPFESEAIIAIGVAYNNAMSEFNGKDVPRPYFKKGEQSAATSTRLSQRVNK